MYGHRVPPGEELVAGKFGKLGSTNDPKLSPNSKGGTEGSWEMGSVYDPGSPSGEVVPQGLFTSRE
jgi:hypothetical protein